MRTVTLTAKVSAATHCRLDAFLHQQTELWNAALAERIDAYQKVGRTITGYDQMKSLTAIRAAEDRFRQFPLHPQRTVLFRLDKAFKSFFRRVKAGQKPGFPRFKGRNRGVRSFDIPKPLIRDGSLCVKGIGRFKLPSLPAGEIVSARVVKTPLRVTVQFIVAVQDHPRAPDMPVGIDMGIKERAILSTGETIPAVHLDRRDLKRNGHWRGQGAAPIHGARS